MDLLQLFLKFLNLSFLILCALWNQISCIIKTTCSAQWIWTLSRNILLRIFQSIFTIQVIFILIRFNLWSLSLFLYLIILLCFLLLIHSFFSLVFLLLLLLCILICFLSIYIFTIFLLNFSNILILLAFLIYLSC